MARFQHLLFVCTNVRSESDPRGACTLRGAPDVRDRLKELVVEHGLQGKVRVTHSGCLDLCARGANVVVFSADKPAAETWYGRVTAADADELFASHVLRGERLHRLHEPTE